MASIDDLVLDLSLALKKQQWKIAVAESCTGGGLAYYMTNLPGSSDWFERGFVTYSNQSKIDLLNVNPATIEKFGAVSEQTAKEMAEGALKNSQAQMSISITGIAGPSGGSAEKPVGTVWFGVKSPHSQKTESHLFSGNRLEIRSEAIKHALSLLLECRVD